MIGQAEITKENFESYLRIIMKDLELDVAEDGSIEYQNNSFKKKLMFKNKSFVSPYRRTIYSRTDTIPLILNSHYNGLSFLVLKKHISNLFLSKILKIFFLLLEYWKNNYANCSNNQHLNQLIFKLNEIYDNNIDDIIEENISKKLREIENISNEYDFEIFVKFEGKVIHEEIQDRNSIENIFNTKHEDFINYVYRKVLIEVQYPLYELINKSEDNRFLGIIFEKRELEILKTIFSHIFKDIDKKYEYENHTKAIKFIHNDVSLEKEGLQLLKRFLTLANNINEFFSEVLNIDELNIKKEMFSINFTEKNLSLFESDIYSEVIGVDGRSEVFMDKLSKITKIKTLNKKLNEKSVIDNTISKKTNYKEKKVKNFNYPYHRNSGNSIPSSSNVFMKPDSSNLISKPILLDETLESFNTYIPLKERLRHSYLLAGPGGGKTSLLEYLYYQDIQNKQCSKIFFDIMGKSTKKIMQFVDKKDLLLLDFTLKEGFTFIINPFNLKSKKNKKISKKDIAFRTKVIINALEKVLGIEWSSNMKVVLVPCIAILLRKGNSNIFELQRLIQGEKELVDLGKKSPNKWHRDFFETQFDDEKLDVTKDAITTKIQALLNEDETFLNMVMGEDTIDLEEAINTKGKTIIIKLPKEANLLARLIVEMIQEIVKKRVVDYPEDEIIDTHVYFDEFQNYITETLEEILAESRNYKLYVTFAHQTLKQMPNKLEDMVLSCTNIKIVGQNSHKNLIEMSKEIQVHIKQLEALKQGEFFLKVGANEAIKIKTTDKFINMEIDEEKYQEHIAYQLEHYYIKIEDENIIEATVDDSKPLAPTKSF
jgi:hypothetical protein